VGSPQLVVAVRHDDQDVQRANAPAQEAHQLQRGAVGPMGVLADDYRRSRPRCQRCEHRPKDLLAGVALDGQLLDLQP
jgi:hypothetical protein